MNLQQYAEQIKEMVEYGASESDLIQVLEQIASMRIKKLTEDELEKIASEHYYLYGETEFEDVWAAVRKTQDQILKSA